MTAANNEAFNVTPIAIAHSCYPEKFGIPRQPGIATAARGTLELLGDFAHPDCIRGLEQCSHLWVLFLFSEHLDRGWSPLVRPPRSGGKKIGVFATRSTFRPNPIGMSVVKLEGIDIVEQKVNLRVSGIDLLEGTPIIDIKPYLPYADSVVEATNHYAPSEESNHLTIHWSAEAEQQINIHPESEYLYTLIEQVLLCDPRPTAHRGKTQEHIYGVRLEDINVRWQITNETIEILSIEQQL